MNLQAVQEESMKKKKKKLELFFVLTWLCYIVAIQPAKEVLNRNVWLTAKSTTVTFFFT